MPLDEDQCQDEMLRALGKRSMHIIHELRSPFAALKGQLQAMERGQSQDGYTRYLTILPQLCDELDRLSRITEGSLLLSGGRELCLELLNLRLLAQQSAEILRSYLIANDIDIALNGNDLYALADRQFVLQIIFNLLTNAVEASPRGSKIEVETSRRGNFAGLAVRDYGSGIPLEQQQQIFSEGFSTKQRGTGYGLAICNRRAEQMQGRIMLTSQPGQGSCFTLLLPPSA